MMGNDITRNARLRDRHQGRLRAGARAEACKLYFGAALSLHTVPVRSLLLLACARSINAFPARAVQFCARSLELAQGGIVTRFL
jgi:hypothetical protein